MFAFGWTIAGCGGNSAPAVQPEQNEPVETRTETDRSAASKPAATPTKLSPTTLGFAASKPQALRPVPTDGSLTLTQYIEAGVPAHDRAWSGAAMERAVSALATLAETDQTQLPRFESPRSGALFDRFISQENFEIYRNRDLSMETRFPDHLVYLRAFTKIHALYLSAFEHHAVGGIEMIEFNGAQLRTAVTTFELMRELLLSVDKENPQVAAGVAKMRRGMATVVSGSLQSLTESHTYRASELKRLVGYLQDSLPTIMPDLPPGSRAEMVVRLRSLSGNPKMQHLQPQLATSDSKSW